MRMLLAAVLCAGVMTSAVRPALSQTADDPARVATRQQLTELLDRVGPEVNMSFRQSDKQPFNFIGTLQSGLSNASMFEVVVSVTRDQTIGFRIYPHYAGGYINLQRAQDGTALMKQLLHLTNHNFLFWGADDEDDVFAGYTFTLESGFPGESLRIVLRSIANLDRFVGELRPAIDGTQAASR